MRRLLVISALALALGGCGSQSDLSEQNESVTVMLADNLAAAQAAAKAEPSSPEAWHSLAFNHVQAARAAITTDGRYTDAGLADLRAASRAWERYLALKPRRVDRDTAEMMLRAYRPPGLDEPDKAAAVQRLLDRLAAG